MALLMMYGAQRAPTHDVVGTSPDAVDRCLALDTIVQVQIVASQILIAYMRWCVFYIVSGKIGVGFKPYHKQSLFRLS